MRNICVACLCLVTATSISALEREGPTWSIKGAPSKVLKKAFYFKAIRSKEAGTIYENLYHGLADKILASGVNTSISEIPEDYELAFQYFKDGKLFYVLVKDFKSFTAYLRKYEFSDEASKGGVVRLNNGLDIKVSDEFSTLPRYLCPPNIAEVEIKRCRLGRPGGTLIDELSKRTYENVALDIPNGFNSIKLINDYTAKTVFSRYLSIILPPEHTDTKMTQPNPSKTPTAALPIAKLEPMKCRIETRYESIPFNENVCDWNNYGPINCRNITTRRDKVAYHNEICSR